MEKIKKYIRNGISGIKYKRIKNMSVDKYPEYLKKRYKKRTGEELDLDHPKKYTEKMQYSKLHCNTPLKSKLTDKYLVREWVSQKIGGKHLIPLLGVWDQYSEINFEKLPEKFVLKTNHNSGGNALVKNKDLINHKEVKNYFDRLIKKNYAFSPGLELHYKDIKPKIIAEKYMEDSNGELNDYKFLCFDGKVYFCWIDVGRFSKHYRNVYNLEWELQPWNQHTYSNTPYGIEKPENFNDMIEIAQRLCQGFSHVRVDLYNINGEIYFGEMTFTNGGGTELIYPEEYNYMLGDLWNIKNGGRS